MNTVIDFPLLHSGRKSKHNIDHLEVEFVMALVRMLF